MFTRTFFLATAAFTSAVLGATCDQSTLNTTSFNYVNDVANQTVEEIAIKFNRGVCDIGRANLMVDVSVVPNVGQTIIIPGEVCDPDSTTCIIDGPGTNDCLVGGPRSYYTLNGDTMWKIAGRLNMTPDAVMCGGDSCNTNITCVDGICPGGGGMLARWSRPSSAYKDLADKYGSTVGQIQMLSPTYNYSYIANEGIKNSF